MTKTFRIDRRGFLCGGASFFLAGCTSGMERQFKLPVSPQNDPYYLSLYGPLPDERFPVPAVDLKKVDPAYYRRVVDYDGPERPGTLVVDTPNRYLYLVAENGQALRYGVGIGRDGFAWSGRARIAYKRAWPTWTPPAEMVARQPELEKFRNGMPPGLQNPLGARALYIFDGNRDTLYRVHGTMEEWSIGRAVSSGCVRLLNQDVIDLASRVPNNTPIIVRPA
ncbi:L,D-transpeptidase [Stappia sp. F7233]|uniref:L,D-transpeptidase n=1 Tax=Stappia albiluteola TaxID=2758565 RepID=A0A839ADL5_9HYPH|nr:L,D-transpeptidase [Stappia albiluteola]MBA5777631.1 L,D-transpeptidase [Stappia albiluteola]